MPAIRRSRIPLSRGIGHGGKGPPQGAGGPIPIPAANDFDARRGDTRITRVNNIFLMVMFFAFGKFIINSNSDYFLIYFLVITPFDDSILRI